MGFLSFLFGSTATVELDEEATTAGGTATKFYHDDWPQRRRKWEVEILEDLYCQLSGKVAVPALLSVGYDGDNIEYIVTQSVSGCTLDELPCNVAKQAVKLAKAAIEPTGYHLPDLEGDGNLRVEWDPDTQEIEFVWVVDVGDCI